MFVITNAQSTFYQTSIVRVCSLDEAGNVKECADMPDDTVFEIGEKLDFIRILDPGVNELYLIYDGDYIEEEKTFIFDTRRDKLNYLYKFMLDFQDKTIFVRNLGDPTTCYLFYWVDSWMQ